MFGKLIGWLADVVREIDHANEVIRVSEERVRYSIPARLEELEGRRQAEANDGVAETSADAQADEHPEGA